MVKMSRRITTAVFLLCVMIYAESTRMIFKDNGYEGIVIAINPQVQEDPELINALKVIWSDASRHLFTATRNRAYFRNITILVPETWTSGNYSSSTRGESYSSADVLVANPNPVFGEFPYTLQYGECGRPGLYIHLTPKYVKLGKFEFDTGNKGKVIAHEWAHLRWGVFDEAATVGYPEFYLAQNSVEATRCPASMRGLNLEVNFNAPFARECPLDENTLLPKPGCLFVPYAVQPNGLNASIMSHQYLQSVFGFCHSDQNETTNLHNTAAPNEQNRLCNLRSTWDVILDSDDFLGGRNPSNYNMQDTMPNFEVVRANPCRYILVMDVSGSMAGERLTTMQRAASLFVSEYVTDGSAVGLVKFHSTSAILSELEEIDGQSRLALEAEIKRTKAAGATGIGSGILKGVEVLGGSGYAGGKLIVLTDGAENRSPFVAAVYNNVTSNGVQMYTIFLDLKSSSANQIMTKLSKDSGGDWFITYSTASNSDINNLFRKLGQCDDGEKIHSNSVYVPFGEIRNGTVKIDSSVGNHTLFTFSWQSSQPQIVLESPGGCVYASYFDSASNYCSNETIHTVDFSLRTMKFTIPGTAQRGVWIYRIKNAGSSDDTFIITVTSKPSDSAVEPVEVEAILTLTDITTATPTLLYVKVTQGFFPVLDASVTAIVTNPSLTTVTRKLFDNGAGPDVRKDDGIYSRYFFQFSQQGRYSVQIKVEKIPSEVREASGGSPAAFSPGIISENGTFVANPNGRANLPNNTAVATTLTDDFERVESGGSFSYTGPPTTTTDSFAPNKVTDLRGDQLNVTYPEGGVLVSITFSAPGDDLDEGNALRYEIRYSFDNASFLLTNFNENSEVQDDDVVIGNLSAPQPAYSEENIVFKIPNQTNSDTMQLFIAVRAYDDSGNPSDPSNVLSMTMFFSRRALPSGPKLPTVETTDSTESDSTSEYTTIATTKRETSSSTLQNPVRTNPAPESLLAYQISLGVLGGIVLTLAITVAVLAVLLTSAKSKDVKRKYEPEPTYENPYA